MRPFPTPDDHTAKRLREALRDADPAAGWDDLSPEESTRLRHIVLAEAARPGVGLVRPSLATAAVASLLMAIGWLLWPADPGEERWESSPAELRATSSPAGVPPLEPAAAPADPPSPPEVVAHVETTPSEPGGSAESRLSNASARTAVAEQPQPPEQPPAEIAPAGAVVAREIRFETRGGTRLIWIFQDDAPDHDEEGVT